MFVGGDKQTLNGGNKLRSNSGKGRSYIFYARKKVKVKNKVFNMIPFDNINDALEDSAKLCKLCSWSGKSLVLQFIIIIGN